MSQRWCKKLLVLTVVDEMCFFLSAAQRQTSGFWRPARIPSRGRPMQLNIVEQMAGGRQEQRNREAGRRKDGMTRDPRTPRKGRLRPVKLQLIQPCCSFHLLSFLVYRNRHLCRGHNCQQNLRIDAWWSRAHKNADVEGQHESGKGRMVPPARRRCATKRSSPPRRCGSFPVQEDKTSRRSTLNNTSAPVCSCKGNRSNIVDKSSPSIPCSGQSSCASPPHTCWRRPWHAWPWRSL